jgi:tRNA(Ile)-lysidine synthase
MDLSRPLAMVSGGPDSVTLVRSLVELGGRPVVLHVDHGLRGKESREDAQFVRELCGRLGLAYEERRARLEGGNLQQEAREQRYRFAEQLADERGISAIATGHTADDAAETVLLNLARGAGLKGLSGIPPVRGKIVRPLIERRRVEVLTYLESLGQPYRTDPTNLTPKYARNRVRLEVLPVLEELYPGAVGNIARSAALLREDLEALEELASGRILGRGGVVTLSLSPVMQYPTAIQRHAVRRAYSVLLPDSPPLDSMHVASVLEMARGPERLRTIELPGGAFAARKPGEITFYRKEPPFLDEINLEIGVQEFAGWAVQARELPELSLSDVARPEVAYLDAGKGPYWVRMAREGDTIRPLGLAGTKRVYRAMMDRKVPRDLRHRTPVVVDGRGRVAWVFLGETSEEFKVGVGTEKVLRLEVEKNP